MASLEQLPNLYNENIFKVDSLLKNSPTLNSNGGSFTIVPNIGMTEYSNSVQCFIVQDAAIGVDAFFDLGDALEVFLGGGIRHIFQFAIKCEEINANPDYTIKLLVDLYLNGIIFETLETDINLSNWGGLEWRTFAQAFEAPTNGDINFRFRFEAFSVGIPNPNFTLNFSGFKLEIDQKNLGLPTAYSLPNGLFQEQADFTQIETDITNLKSMGGWAQYADTTYTSVSPFTITAGTTSILDNNANTNISTYLPIGVTSFYNGVTNTITPNTLGDKYIINVRFKAKTSVNNDFLSIGLDIGGSLNVIIEETKPFLRGANTEQKFNIVFPIYSLATFLANGGLIKVTANSGNLQIYDIVYVIERTYKSIV